VTATHIKSSFHSLIPSCHLFSIIRLPSHETLSIRSQLSLRLSLMLRPTVSRPVYRGIKHPSGAYDQIFITVRQLRVCWCGALFLARGRVSFTIAAGPRQRSHSRVRVPWDSRPYFTVSESRLPISSPPTTRGATVEVFDPPPYGILPILNLNSSL
jgi:hypothetical protein